MSLALGASNMCGRLSSATLIFFPKAKATIVSGIGCGISAVTILLMPFVKADQFVPLLILCVFFGFFIGMTNSMRALVYVENFGLENLTNAYGLFSVAIGTGCVIGPVVAAKIRDITGDYFWSFIFGGVFMAISMFVTLLAPIIRNYEYKKKGPP